MSQEDLADAAGVSKQTILMFESGRTIPYDDTIEKIRVALENRGIRFTNGNTPTVSLDRSKAIIPT